MAHDTVQLTVQGHILRIHSCGNYILLAAEHGSIYVLNFNCELVRTLEVGQSINGENSMTVGNDGAIIGDSSGYISTWSPEQDVPQRNWRLREDPITAITTIDTTKVACGYSDGLIQVIGTNTGSLCQAYIGHAAAITALIYVGAKDSLISSCEKEGEVRLWNSVSGQCLCTIQTPAQLVRCVGGKRFATGSRESPTVRVWSVSDGNATAALSPPSTVRGTLNIEPYQLGQVNGVLTSHRDGSIRIWDYDRGVQLYGFETGKKAPHYLPAVPLNVYEHNGEAIHRIVSGHKEGTVRLWRIPAPSLRPGSFELDRSEELPSLYGEKILKTKKSDTDRWALAYPLTVLNTVNGTAVGVVRVKLLSSSTPDQADSAKYHTDFGLCHIDEKAW